MDLSLDVQTLIVQKSLPQFKFEQIFSAFSFESYKDKGSAAGMTMFWGKKNK